MSSSEQMQQDLAYIRRAVEQRGDQRTPLSVALVWSAYALIGFPWLDFDPERAAWFLILASPVAFGISWVFGWRAAWRLGEWDSEVGRRQGLHWGGFFLAFAAVLAMAFAGQISGNALGQVILILVGWTYYLAGVHLGVRLFLWLGPLMILGAVALTYIDRWGWTMIGVLLAIALVASSFLGGRRNERA